MTIRLPNGRVRNLGESDERVKGAGDESEGEDLSDQGHAVIG